MVSGSEALETYLSVALDLPITVGRGGSLDQLPLFPLNDSAGGILSIPPGCSRSSGFPANATHMRALSFAMASLCGGLGTRRWELSGGGLRGPPVVLNHLHYRLHGKVGRSSAAVSGQRVFGPPTP